jgi:hypothetical protein
LREIKLEKLGSDWDSILQGVGVELKDTVGALSDHVAKLDGVTHAIQGKSIRFYHGKVDARNLFTAFLLTENSLKVRIATDPSVEFQDPLGWTGDGGHKPYFAWLLGVKQIKKEFTVTGKEQIEYAMDLITQSYLQTSPIPHELKKTSITNIKWYKGTEGNMKREPMRALRCQNATI